MQGMEKRIPVSESRHGVSREPPCCSKAALSLAEIEMSETEAGLKPLCCYSNG